MKNGRLTELVDELHEMTGGRGKWWQAAGRAIRQTLKDNSDRKDTVRRERA